MYYMRGQEEKLEDYYKYLHPREAEAFLLLREHKVLKDSDQDPATRVALRSIKDFSVGFKMNEDIYWRFVSVPKEEVNAILNGNVVEEKVQEAVEEKIEEKIEKNNSEMVEPVVKEIKIKSESNNKFNNPLVMDKEIRKKSLKRMFIFLNQTSRPRLLPLHMSISKTKYIIMIPVVDIVGVGVVTIKCIY